MRFVVLFAVVATASAVACDKPPVDWTDPVVIRQTPGQTRLILDSGLPRFAPDSARAETLPPSQGRCNADIVTTSSPKESAAAWWSVRADSSAVLFVSASVDSGRTWRTPTAVDTTDVSSNGCHRPPPSLVAVGDDVYVAYSMSAPEGVGVFFAHTMSGMLHSPVPVIYGERLVSTAIAANASHVAVAYEEPNGTREQVDVAISATQGHLFETHTTASRSVDNAVSPVVALTDSMVAVSWATRGLDDSAGTRVVRVGRLTSWK